MCTGRVVTEGPYSGLGIIAFTHIKLQTHDTVPRVQFSSRSDAGTVKMFFLIDHCE